jgi:STAM-binding protein
MAYNKPGGSFRLATRPRNIEEITRAAQSYEYSAVIPLRYWLRTAATMLKEVI